MNNAAFSSLIPLTTVLILAAFVAPASPSDEAFEAGWEAYHAQDFSRAHELWRPLAESGQVSAQINLGMLFQHGLGVERSPERAAHWYRVAARKGEPVAQFDLALLLRDEPRLAGRGESTAGWLEASAEQHYPAAELELGRIRWESARTPGDSAAALDSLHCAGIRYLAAADSGSAGEALFALRDRAPGHTLTADLARRLNREAARDDPEIPLQIRRSFGTAWPVGAGVAITNHHIVSGKSRIVLLDSAGEELEATVILADAESDLAVLSVREPERLPAALPIAKGDAALGAGVFTLGFPRVDVMGRSPKLTHGIVSGTTGPRDDPRSYLLSVPIQPGNSGGPLLNMNGEVVGVVTSMLGVTDAQGSTRTLSHVSYALKSTHLRSILALAFPSRTVIEELPAEPATLEVSPPAFRTRC